MINGLKQKELKNFAQNVTFFDIKNINAGSLFILTFLPSDECRYIIDLIRVSDNTVVSSLPYSYLPAGIPAFSIAPLYYSTKNGLYKWRIKYISITDEYNGSYALGWQQKELEFMHIPTLPSNISSNTILNAGNYNINSDVTINSGITLTVKEGVNLLFKNNSSLIVKGHLDVDGVEDNKAVFDFVSPDLSSTNGIKINAGASADIDFADIKNGYYGVYANQSVPTINDSKFTSCTYPVYIYKSNYVSGKASIINNVISGANNAGTGIYLYESSPYIRDNIISGFNKGVYCKSNSSPLLGSGIYHGNNHFNHNTTGVKSYYDSYPFLGKGALGGYNLFTSDHLYYIYAKYDCEIDAENNWWGTASLSSTKFYESSGSDIDYTPYLSSDPSLSQNFIEDNSGAITLNVADENNIDIFTEGDNLLSTSEKTEKAVDMYLSGSYESAKNNCKEIIAITPDSPSAVRALDLLWQIATKKDNPYTLENFKSYIYDLMNKKEQNNVSAHAMLIFCGFDMKKGLVLLDKIAADYQGTLLGEAALFKKMMYYYHEKSDYASANKILDDLKTNYPESELIADGESMLKGVSQFSLKKEMVKENIIPEKYTLHGAYPNPFNPSTTIKYELPRQSAVTVDIYNIRGQKVKEYSYSSQNAGAHLLTWNGQNQYGAKAASGLYIIRFKAQALEGEAEVFQKSLKVIMLK